LGSDGSARTEGGLRKRLGVRFHREFHQLEADTGNIRAVEVATVEYLRMYLLVSVLPVKPFHINVLFLTKLTVLTLARLSVFLQKRNCMRQQLAHFISITVSGGSV